MTLVQRFERNTVGRDFCVGDVHGCFDLLDALLAQAGFDKAVDRLFSVGDLVDRGPGSDLVQEWLSQPWFHAVRGNHEQMVVDTYKHGGDDWLHVANGGAWLLGLPETEQRATPSCSTTCRWPSRWRPPLAPSGSFMPSARRRVGRRSAPAWRPERKRTSPPLCGRGPGLRTRTPLLSRALPQYWLGTHRTTGSPDWGTCSIWTQAHVSAVR